MVCLPCLIVPAVLFIWYRFLQPIFARIWNPFGSVTNTPKVDANGSVDKSDSAPKELPGASAGKTSEAKCPISGFASKDPSKVD